MNSNVYACGDRISGGCYGGGCGVDCSGGGGGGGGDDDCSNQTPINIMSTPPRTSFVPVPPGADFTHTNVPFGVFSPTGASSAGESTATRHCATIVGDTVIDLLGCSSFLTVRTIPRIGCRGSTVFPLYQKGDGSAAIRLSRSVQSSWESFWFHF